MNSPDYPEPNEPPEPSHEEQAKDEPMLFCPVCDNRLTNMRCKLICSRCGYYMSCADYY